jgi:kynurenine formamidase
VLIRTGWNQIWKNNMNKSVDEAQRDNAEANSGEPGASPELCDHLAARKVSMLGMDNWGIEPYDFAKVPPTLIKAWAYCHMNLTTRRGIYLFENLDLEQPAADRAYEFLFAWAPLKLVGATGSPGNPIATY